MRSLLGLRALLPLAMAAGCVRTPGVLATPDAARPAPAPTQASQAPARVSEAIKLDLLLGEGRHAAGSAALFPDIAGELADQAAFKSLMSLSGGLVSVGDFADIADPTFPTTYTTQLLPVTTNLRADEEARAWASDAKQMYIAAGFWHWPVLGLTKHVYYSKRKGEKFILYFRLFKGLVERRVRTASCQYKMGDLLMEAAQDAYGWDLPAALKRAHEAYYRPEGSITVGVMIHPRVLGPCWVFLDNPTEQKPQIAVQARNGQIWREGDLPFEAIKLLVTPSDDEKPLDPSDPGEPKPGVCP